MFIFFIFLFQIISAIRLAPDEASARKFLHVAQNLKDPSVFHSVMFYFKNSTAHSNNFGKGK